MGTQLQPSKLIVWQGYRIYLSSVHAIPILTKEEEQELALRLWKDDLDALRHS